MDKPEEPIHQRINQLIETFEGGVQRRFAQTVGIATGVVGDMLGQRKSKPGFDLASKILQAYPQIRAEWLMLGEGEMLKPDILPSTLRSASETRRYIYKGKTDYELPILNEAEQEIQDKIEAAYQEGSNRAIQLAMIYITDSQKENTLAPIYNPRTATDYKSNGVSQEHPEPDGIISFPNWLLHHGDHAVFPVTGDSMEPTFFAKDYVLCRFVPKTEWADFREDTVAVIVSESRGLQLKRLTFRIGESYVRCKSDNRQHPSYNIELDEVLEIWRFELRITANAHNSTEGLSERVSTVEDSLEGIRILLEQVLDKRELRRLNAQRPETQ